MPGPHKRSFIRRFTGIGSSAEPDYFAGKYRVREFALGIGAEWFASELLSNLYTPFHKITILS
jgi:hypothetical protein